MVGGEGPGSILGARKEGILGWNWPPSGLGGSANCKLRIADAKRIYSAIPRQQTKGKDAGRKPLMNA